jgi:hypothetical protein
MTSLSVSNLIVSIGIAFDAQLKAADNLFFSAAVDFTDPTRPMFGGSVGDAAGSPTTLGTTAIGYASANNAVSGDPVTVRQVSTAEGPRYQVTDNNGREIKIETAASGGSYRNVPRYLVKADGLVYDVLAPVTASGTGAFSTCDPTQPNGMPGSNSGGTPSPVSATAISIDHYARPIGRITFKAKEGATLARAQDDLQRTGSIVQLLTRLLESIQDEGKGFSSLIR